MEVFQIKKFDIPRKLKSSSKGSAFTSEVSNWCKSQNIKYDLIWEAKGGEYKLPSGRWVRGQIVTNIQFKSKEDFVAFKLRWF